MKLRLKNNSVRFRLTQPETARLTSEGRVEEAIEFGPQAGGKFVFALETIEGKGEIRAIFDERRLTIFIPRERAAKWSETGQIGLEAEQNIGGEKTLRLLIEKDFACLAPRAGEDDSDAFPHPTTEGKFC